MSFFKNLICLIILLIGANNIAQEITVAEPEFEGQIFYVDNNTQVDLEDNVYSSKQGSSVGRMISGIGKVKATIVVKGNTSPVQLKKKENMFFICNYNGTNATLPTKIIETLKFEKKRETREYVVASSSNVSGQTEGGVVDFVKFQAQKYGNHSYLVEFVDLRPGEYGFSIGGEDSGKNVYMFTVVD
ncbi:MAG: hypothetical protein Q8O88_02990 [bacterium]|nr:hypothetical protein [bacterium]